MTEHQKPVVALIVTAHNNKISRVSVIVRGPLKLRKRSHEHTNIFGVLPRGPDLTIFPVSYIETAIWYCFIEEVQDNDHVS